MSHYIEVLGRRENVNRFLQKLGIEGRFNSEELSLLDEYQLKLRGHPEELFLRACAEEAFRSVQWKYNGSVLTEYGISLSKYFYSYSDERQFQDSLMEEVTIPGSGLISKILGTGGRTEVREKDIVDVLKNDRGFTDAIVGANKLFLSEWNRIRKQRKEAIEKEQEAIRKRIEEKLKQKQEEERQREIERQQAENLARIQQEFRDLIAANSDLFQIPKQVVSALEEEGFTVQSTDESTVSILEKGQKLIAQKDGQEVEVIFMPDGTIYSHVEHPDGLGACKTLSGEMNQKISQIVQSVSAACGAPVFIQTQSSGVGRGGNSNIKTTETLTSVSENNPNALKN